MTGRPSLWLRHETRPDEHRAPIVPEDAGRLVAGGATVTVEDSPQRVFPLTEYAKAGCRTAEPGAWAEAPADTIVVGLKELPDDPAELRHRHVFFGHAYKGQPGAAGLIRRFVAGGGALLDLESLVDARGRRLVAFGHWAGYLGAALAVLLARGRLGAPLRSTTKADLDAVLAPRDGEPSPSSLVIGALGRCGGGAREALAAAGLRPTCWDLPETRNLDKRALLDHDIVINTVFQPGRAVPFLTPGDLDRPDRRMTVVCDVTCDVGSESNTLPIYDAVTDWTRPVRRLREGPPALDLIAIDNLPSLLPREASTAFSAALRPHLFSLADPDDRASPWGSCLAKYREACRSMGIDGMEAGND